MEGYNRNCEWNSRWKNFESGWKVSFVDYTTVWCLFSGLKGSCLVEIAKSCTQLRRLSIGFLGSALKDSNSLSIALEYMTSLKDLRLDDNGFVFERRICVAMLDKRHDICMVSLMGFQTEYRRIDIRGFETLAV